MFVWGWTPFVDPDPMLSYFTCDQVSSDPDDPSNYYNDANLCDPEYDKLYKQQTTELDPAKRMEIVHEMLTRFYSHAVYLPLYYQGDLQAYRKDRFTGWQRQPADIGPGAVLEHVAVVPDAEARVGDDAAARRAAVTTAAAAATGIIIALVAVGVVGAGGLLWARSRRASADERE